MSVFVFGISKTRKERCGITEEEKEKKHLFALFYACCKNVPEAAVKAGFPPETAYAEGLKLLKLRSTKKLVRRFMQSGLTAEEEVRIGLDRLAFGEINDVIQAALSEDPPGPHKLLQMNCFNISEVKRVKGGGVEFKIFDRQKAMEKLLELYDKKEQSRSAAEFLTALSEAPHQEESYDP